MVGHEQIHRDIGEGLFYPIPILPDPAYPVKLILLRVRDRLFKISQLKQIFK